MPRPRARGDRRGRAEAQERGGGRQVQGNVCRIALGACACRGDGRRTGTARRRPTRSSFTLMRGTRRTSPRAPPSPTPPFLPAPAPTPLLTGNSRASREGAARAWPRESLPCSTAALPRCRPRPCPPPVALHPRPSTRGPPPVALQPGRRASPPCLWRSSLPLPSACSPARSLHADQARSLY